MDGAPSALTQLLKIAASIVAPTTFLTGLLFYFGWSHAYQFSNYFGLNSTLLGLTTQDYLMRSVDGLFVPLTVVATVGLVAVWGHTLQHGRLLAGSRVLQPVLVFAGLVLFAIGLWGIFARTVFEVHLAVSPLSLATGVLLLAYVSRARRAGTGGPAWLAMVEWAAVIVLVGISLFWVVHEYSVAVGISRAQQLESRLPALPSTVVYSSQSLSLQAPGVREVACEDPDAAYRFRYEGLKLVMQSGDQYFFLPEAWSREEGVAILMPRSESLRLEFFPASAADDALSSTC